MVRMRPSWPMKIMSRLVMVLRIHICETRGRPQSNNMPPSGGTLGRNIRPIDCSRGSIAISTLK